MKKTLVGIVLATLTLSGCAHGTNDAVSSNTSQKSSVSTVVRHAVTVRSKMSELGIPGLRILSSNLDVVAGQQASLTIRTKPGTKATIEVDYSTGPSQDSNLRPKTADNTGNVTWSWRVPQNTTPGTWSVTVKADGKSMMLQLDVTK